jgi:hypothetical protein
VQISLVHASMLAARNPRAEAKERVGATGAAIGSRTIPSSSTPRPVDRL